MKEDIKKIEQDSSELETTAKGFGISPVELLRRRVFNRLQSELKVYAGRKVTKENVNKMRKKAIKVLMDEFSFDKKLATTMATGIILSTFKNLLEESVSDGMKGKKEEKDNMKNPKKWKEGFDHIAEGMRGSKK